MKMESSLSGTETQANISPYIKHIPIGSPRWTFLQIAQCWRLVHPTKRRSCGTRKLGKCMEIQSVVVAQFTVFGFRRLVNLWQ
jgi:hypothetical protein